MNLHANHRHASSEKRLFELFLNSFDAVSGPTFRWTCVGFSSASTFSSNWHASRTAPSVYLTNANVSPNDILGQKQLQAISFVSAHSMSAFQCKIDVD